MATANGSRLISRLAAAIKAAEASPAILPDIAFDTIADVSTNASALAGQEYQVGFDLAQFQANIAQPGTLRVIAPGVGSIGILDPERMGTVDDFEKIAGLRLFHQGTRDPRGVWRDIAYPDPEWRAEIEADRKAVWGDKTPQWLLLEEGFTGNGAFPATPPHHFIADGTRPTAILARMRAAASRVFRGL